MSVVALKMHLASEHRGIRNEVRVRLVSIMWWWSRNCLLFTACAGHTTALKRNYTVNYSALKVSKQTYVVATCSDDVLLLLLLLLLCCCSWHC
jgi:hypothetical protein